MPQASETTNDEFEDPLEHYEPPSFDDPIERAMHDEPVTALQTRPHACVSADTSVRDAMKLMVGRRIACVLVAEDDRLVGVFGDRDVLDKVALEYQDVIDGPVRNVMSASPVFVAPEDNVAAALSIMAATGFRHVPVVTSDGKPVGIVSPQRMAHFLLAHLES